MPVAFIASPDATTIALHGDLDAADIPALREAFDRCGMSAVVVDARRLRYVESSVIGLLIETSHRIRALGHSFRVVASRETSVARIFDVVSLHTLLDLTYDLG